MGHGPSRAAGLRCHFRLWCSLVRQHLLGLLEYRLDFLLGAFSMLLIHLGTFLLFYLVFENIHSLAGFRFPEVAFIFGFSILPQGLITTFASSLFAFGPRVQNGELDRILLRPLDPVFQIVASRADANGFGHLIIGLGLIIWAAPRCGLALPGLWWLLFPLLLAAAGVILFSINLTVAATAFWTVRNDAAMRLLQEADEFSAYPLPIFSRPVRILLTGFLPLAFTGFYPACLLLGREEYAKAGWATLAVAPLVYLLSRWIFRRGLSRYESTGH